MWGLVLIILEVLCLLPPEARSAKKADEAMGRTLEKFRWLIYGAILLGVLMLIVAGIALLLAP